MNKPFDVLHIGFPKTASTYLQTVVFPEHPEISFSWREHKHVFFDLRDYGFGFDKSAFIARLNDTTHDSTNEDCKVRMFSAEALSGDAYSGLGGRMIIDLLADLLPDAKVMVMIREQRSYVASVWNAYVMEGGTLGIKGFLTQHASPAISFNIPRGIDQRECYANIYEKLRYDRFVRYGREIFGENRFGVFFFEDLRRDPEIFFNNVFSFIGVDPGHRPRVAASNVSFVDPWRTIFQVFCRFCQTQHNESGILPYRIYHQARLLTQGLSYRFPIMKRTSTRAVERHLPEWARVQWRESNRQLAKMTGRDVGELGYDV